MMSTVQEVAFCFNYSAKRLLRYQEALTNDAENRAAMTRRSKLQSLCETRWAARADALFTFKSSFTSVVDALDDLSTNYGDSKAGAFKLAITQFGFIVTLVAIEYMLAELAPLSKLLQNKECDLVEATKEAKTIANLVAEQRNDERLWDELYDKSVELAASVDVNPSKPRTVGRQQHRGNAPSDTVSGYWRLNMFLPFMDHLASELSDRLLQAEDRLLAQYLIPANSSNLTDEHIHAIYTAFKTDLTARDFEEFESEIRRWRARHSFKDSQLSTISETLAN